MKVVACSGAGRVRVEDRTRPSPGPGEVLLRLSACGLCGTDLFKLASGGAREGDVLGHEVVGVVAQCGEGVGRFAAGERAVVPHHVSCGDCELCRRGSETMCAVFRENLLEPGGFSEYVLVRERAVRRAMRRIPDGLADEAAVFLEPAACVLRGVERSGLGERGAAVVLGGGSMGLLHLLVLDAARPEVRVVVVEPEEERRRLALSLGAYRACAPEEASPACALASGGLGADAVFDTVGGAGALERALALLRDGGTAVLFAHAPPGEAPRFDLNHVFKGERRIVGTYSGALREQDAVWRLLVSGRLDPSALVTARVPLARFDDAVAAVRSRRALKVLLEPSSER